MVNRRVVTGTADGKEVVTSDEQIETMDLNGVTLASLWRIDAIPTVPTDGTVPTSVSFPEPGNFWICTFTVPPNFTIEYEEDLVAFAEGRPGFHRTDTVDVDVILDGEIVLEIEDGTEVELKKGDTLVVSGTGHAWHNRTDRPATVLAAVYGAKRAA